MPIFSFIAKLGLDVTDFQSGIKRAESSATGMAGKVRGSINDANKALMSGLAGFFTASAAKSYFHDLSAMVGEIKDMSELLGISTDEVQRLQKATAEAGQGFGSVVTAFQKIEQMRAQALTGDTRSQGIFQILGIDPGKGSSLEVFKAAISASAGGVQQNAAAFELLGKKVGGLKLIVEELDRLGPIKLIDEAQLEAIDSAAKKMEEASRQFKIAGAPAATTFLQGATGLLNMFNPENRARQEEINQMVARGEIGFRKELELSAMSLLGIKDDEGRKYTPLEMPNRTASRGPETTEQLLLRIARANEQTAQILDQNTK